MLEREIEAVLYAPRERRDDLQRANQRLREARADATANGAIRYDKDKVICSPTDDMLNNKVARILDAEESVNEAEKGLKCAQHMAWQFVKKIDDDLIREICKRYYCEMKSCRQIGYEMLYSAMTISRYKQKGFREIAEKC